jgi:hypothetical protein
VPALLLLALAAADAPTSVALDLSALPDATYTELHGLALEKTIVLRLVQDGHAVVALRGPADVVIRVTAADGALVLRVDGCPVQRRVARGDGPLDETHLEAAQKASELVSICRSRATPAPASPPQQQEQAPTTSAPPPEPGPPLVPARSVGFGLSAGVAWRLYDADLAINADVWIPFLGRGWGIVSLQWTPSSVSQVTVNELQLTAGVGRSVVSWRALDLALLLQGGARVQFFQLTDASLPDPSGTLVSGVGELRAVLRWRFTRSLCLTVGLAGGFWAPSYDHFVNGSPIWVRSPLFLEGTLGIVWGR